MKTEIADYFDTVARNMAALKAFAPQIEAATLLCIEGLAQKGKIIWCGNGGSAAEAQHMSAELVGRYLHDRDGLASIALTVDSSNLTSIGNDYGFEHIFARQLRALGHPGDVLVALSTSGESENVIRAIEEAKKKGIKVIGLTGASGGRMRDICDVWIGVPSQETNHIQEMHTATNHFICGKIERHFMTVGMP